jgi:hypothetical protein
MMIHTMALFTTAVAATTHLRASRDQVLSLPGWVGAPPTKHWSGFVEVEPGTHLYYYLVESASVPSEDPLVWWMNGGPGASSLVGLFAENGPLLLNSSMQLTPNPYAFNTKANVLYVEFGPGIGFSYCTNSSAPAGAGGCAQSRGDCSPCYSSDSSVARQSAQLLTRLVSDKALFPDLALRPTYLVGESYAGVYIPTLAYELLAMASAVVDLRGLWATDPCTDNAAQHGWLDLSVEFAFQKGLIDGPTHELLKDESHGCVSGRTQVGDRVRNTTSVQCRAAWRLYDLSTAGLGDAVHPPETPGLPMYIDPLSAIGTSGGPALELYLNRSETRQAIHATTSPNAEYHIEIGNNGYPQYTLEYAACNDHAPPNATSMVDVYHELLRAPSVRDIVISSGDVDPVVELHGTEAAVRKIGVPIAPGGARRPWFFNDTATQLSAIANSPAAWGPMLHAHSIGPQVGGFTTSFARGSRAEAALTFVTFKGSGHMVPAYAPQRALHVLHRLLLGGEQLAPPLPADWASSSDAQFYARGGAGARPGLFTQWVVEAMGVVAT